MTNTPDTNQGASAHSPTPTALDKQVASLHELYGRLHENIEQFQAGWITADEYSRRHGILSEAISEVRADGIDLVAYGLDPTIGSSNPPKSPDTPDQVDALDAPQGASEEPQLPVIIDGKQVGTLSLSTAYRLMIDDMLLDAEFQLGYFRGRLKELDEAVSTAASTKPLADDKSSKNAPSEELEKQREATG